MKKQILISCLLLAVATSISAQQTDFPKLTGPYLGQKPPGMTPEIFAPGIITFPDTKEFACTFSPDGKYLFFQRSNDIHWVSAKIIEDLRPKELNGLNIEKPLTLFFELKYKEALPLFKQIIEQDSMNAEAQTWLAETYRRIGVMDAAIENARKALLVNPRSSFAHLVIAQASYPNNDSIYVHVEQAVKCDSTDPNAWLMMWGEAIKHDNPLLHDKTLKKLAETGFLTKAALAYGRSELRHLPPNAIYITNGDMDTYPAKIVQISEGFRTDVTVIEREHLGINWACRFIRDHQNVPLPISDAELDVMRELTDAQGKKISTSEQNFRKWIEQKRRGEFTRPITIAPTVEESFYEFDKEHFHYRGMHLLWQPEAGSEINDTTALRQCLSNINPDDFMGPWASLKDRSPVRRYYTKEIVRNLFWIALTYSKDLITAKRFDEAEKTLQWLDAFEKRTELGPVSTDEIKELRELMNR